MSHNNIVQSGVTWHGKVAALATINQNDLVACTCPDCNRAEVAELPNGSGGLIDEANSLGQTIYYGASFKIPVAWQSHPATWEIVLQLHGPSEYGTNPLFAFDLGPKVWQVNIKGGDVGSSPNTGFQLSPSAIAYDKWTDLIIAVNYQKTATGFFKVWRRDEGASVFTLALNKTNISTLQFSGTGPLLYHYWKTGIYRQCVNRTDTALLGPFVRATTFLNAECAAFGTQNGQP